MNSILTQICNTKLRYLESKKLVFPQSILEELLNRKQSQPSNFVKAIKKDLVSGGNVIIAECKKGSPSLGVIDKDYNPYEIAKTYKKQGATCLSVLTDTDYFYGSSEHLMLIKQSVQELPILRKDFIIDEYQIYESKLIGADCILLIAKVLEKKELQHFIAVAHSLQMDVLVEVHNREELKIALDVDCELIGINNRNLETLTVDLSVSEKLIGLIPSNKIVVCESGINSIQDITRMKQAGLNIFLIGSSLMKKNITITELTNTN